MTQFLVDDEELAELGRRDLSINHSRSVVAHINGRAVTPAEL